MDKQRIDFIDLAKGVCMLIVFTLHVGLTGARLGIADFLTGFRIPLFFILSGLFLSFSGGGKLFIQKKINRLIIPYCFFVFIFNIIYWIPKDVLHGYNNGLFASPFEWFSPIQRAYMEGDKNGPLWFLLALFNSYIIFFFLQNTTKGHLWIKSLLIMAVGCLGCIFKRYGMDLHFFIVNGMMGVPFLFIGELIRKYTHILSSNKLDVWNIPIAIACFLLLMLTAKGQDDNIPHIIPYYFNGIIGTVGVLCLCKRIKYLPVISYIGRYSLIALGVHMIPMIYIHQFFASQIKEEILVEIITLTGIIIFTLISIPVLKKIVPWSVGERDILFI